MNKHLDKEESYNDQRFLREVADNEGARAPGEVGGGAPFNDDCNAAADDDVNSQCSQDRDGKSPLHHRIERANSIIMSIIKWSLGILLLCFIAFVIFGILYSGVSYHDSQSNIAPGSECTTPFGSILGVHDGVFSYSNCNESYTSNKDTEAPKGFNVSGMQWQCVEYARRYWMIRGISSPASFASVEGANDIWSLKNVQLKDGSSVPLLKYANGAEEKNGGSAPRVGDLLIYPRQEGGFPYGHVAVIVGVTEKSVLVGEQNWENEVWPAPYHNYSREIELSYNSASKAYKIVEKDNVVVQGWMRY